MSHPTPQAQGIGTGYSLWLVPNRSKEPFQWLNALIGSIARQFGSPAFPPHVTLLADIQGPLEVISIKTSFLANGLQPYELCFDRIGSKGWYFQLLFALAVPTLAVRAANLAAREVFELLGNTPYMPHLSFVYGHLNQSELAAIEEEVLKHSLEDMTFVADRIELWSTIGPVSEWRHIETFALRSATTQGEGA